MVESQGTPPFVHAETSAGGLFRQARSRGSATETSKIYEGHLEDLGAGLAHSQKAVFLLPFPSLSLPASIGNSIQDPSCRGEETDSSPSFSLSLFLPASTGEANIFNCLYL
jgi:hypothetical protein